VKRIFLALVLAALVFEVSGIAEMLVPELCAPVESKSQHDSCSSTCVRCTCCRQPVTESTRLATADDAAPPTCPLAAIQNPSDDPQVRDITHVPKSRLS
jgi:hypothetical protein